MSDLLHIVHSDQTGPLSSSFQCFLVGYVLRRKKSIEGTFFAQSFGERSRIDALNARNPVLKKIARQIAIGSPITHHRGQFPDHKARKVRFVGFFIHGVHPVVADEGIGHGNDLSLVGRVGQNLLIARHGCVEANFATYRGFCSKTTSSEQGSILKC